MVFDAVFQALANFAVPGLWFFTIAGVITGLLVGVIPGIGGLVGLALFLPFAFTLSPVEALPFMVAFTAATFTGGSITSILLSIPGEESSAALILDGFPMTKKGEGGRALGAALTASASSGIITAIMAIAMIPLVLPMIMAFTSAEMVFIILLGIAFIAVLSRGSMAKGFISGGIGLLLAAIGFQVSTGVGRYTFNSLYLYDGIDLIPLAVGLFALPEILDLMAKGGTLAKVDTATQAVQHIADGARDVVRHGWLWFRSCIIGYVIGILPGIGAISASFLAYGQAKQTSKNGEKFGTGAVEGVIAPQAAENASLAGALLTTLALGIPGSASTAIFLGAFTMLGLIPGPEMLTSHLDLSITLMFIVIVANMIAVAICLPLTRYMVKMAIVPSRVLVPIILVVALVGTYVSQEEFLDVITAIVFAGLGMAMVKFGYNRPALFLAFILGDLFEKYLFISVKAIGPLFFLRPVSAIIILITIGVLFLNPLKTFINRRFRKGAIQV